MIPFVSLYQKLMRKSVFLLFSKYKHERRQDLNNQIMNRINNKIISIESNENLLDENLYNRSRHNIST